MGLRATGSGIRGHTLFCDALSLSRPGPLRHRLADHGHEIPIFVSGEAGKVAKIVFAA